MHVRKDEIVKFKRNKTGSCGCVFPEKHREHVNQLNKEQKAGHQHIETMAENRGNCSTQECERACRARKLCHNTGAPTTRNFKSLLDGNMIRNCPAIADDVETAEGTWGPDVSCLKASATRPKPDPVRMDQIETPKELHQKHQEIALCIDGTCIDGAEFLTSTGHLMHCRGCAPVEDRKNEEHCKALDKTSRKFDKVGFRIKIVECDGAFRSLMEEASDGLHADMNCVSAGEHVPRAERNNRTTKDSFRRA